MTVRLRKLALTAHIALSVGWVGAVTGFLALSITALASHDADVIRSSYFAMNLIGWLVILPMSVTALITGVIQASGTEWGLFRHYWVLVKFVLTTFATVVLLVKMPLISYAARQATEMPLPNADLRAAGVQLTVHAAGGLLVLLAITAVSVLKPWGKTRYGRQRESASLVSCPSAAIGKASLTLSEPETTAGPKKLLAIIGGIVVGFAVLHLVVLHLIFGGLGNHGH